MTVVVSEIGGGLPCCFSVFSGSSSSSYASSSSSTSCFPEDCGDFRAFLEDCSAEVEVVATGILFPRGNKVNPLVSALWECMVILVSFRFASRGSEYF